MFRVLELNIEVDVVTSSNFNLEGSSSSFWLDCWICLANLEVSSHVKLTNEPQASGCSSVWPLKYRTTASPELLEAVTTWNVRPCFLRQWNLSWVKDKCLLSSFMALFCRTMCDKPRLLGFLLLSGLLLSCTLYEHQLVAFGIHKNFFPPNKAKSARWKRAAGCNFNLEIFFRIWKLAEYLPTF